MYRLQTVTCSVFEYSVTLVQPYMFVPLLAQVLLIHHIPYVGILVLYMLSAIGLACVCAGLWIAHECTL